MSVTSRPIDMSSQERIALANLLDRMAENPADYFDPDKLKLAADCIHYHEAKLALIRSAVE